jgi:hypothetical protein
VGNLGAFGESRPALDDTFTFIGREFRVHPDLTDLNLIRFMELAGDIDEDDEVRARDLVVGQLQQMVHPDEWAGFLDHSIEHRQHYKDLMVLMKDLIQAVSRRPTQRRSDSPPGRRKTKTKSKGTSSKRAQDGPAKQVVRRLELAGRPDLALAVVEADEQQRTG